MDATQGLGAILRDARKGRAPQDEVGDIFTTSNAGYPVRCGLLDSITTALEYWIIRWSLSSGGACADPVADDDGCGCVTVAAFQRPSKAGSAVSAQAAVSEFARRSRTRGNIDTLRSNAGAKPPGRDVSRRRPAAGRQRPRSPAPGFYLCPRQTRLSAFGRLHYSGANATRSCLLQSRRRSFRRRERL
jgi:hypothetical protein